MSEQPDGGARTITSRHNPLLQQLRRLGQDPGAYRKLGRVWLEGDHLCRAFLARGGRPLVALLPARNAAQPPLRALTREAAQSVVVDDALWSDLSTLESPPPIGFLIEWQPAPPLLPRARSVVLDRLQDAGNVGTILRSAAALGVQQVVALRGTAALWSPKVLRAGMGAHFGLHLVEGVGEEALSALEMPWVATSSHASAALPEVRLPDPCAWVLGHEGQGVGEALMQRCALTVRIPQPGGEESLNVASAAAICLYESARQRWPASAPG
ncbi:TrmH family RNA methyltransferase [Caldimonas tepidiphila]|uniref:TrmH family RNA methyltransferase n=1 Tax=Caldimonas tepidiphila TaxID=2315841 RepID=UPI000E5A707F|nr:RNA methyltransferase [Caldimonas tepidiphila]